MTLRLTPAETLGRHSSLYRRVHETDRPRALLTGSANEWTGTDRPSALLPRQSPVPSRDRRANANGPSRDCSLGWGGGGGRAAEVGGAGRGRQRASKVVRSGMSERNQGAIDCGKLTADPLTLDYKICSPAWRFEFCATGTPVAQSFHCWIVRFRRNIYCTKLYSFTRTKITSALHLPPRSGPHQTHLPLGTLRPTEARYIEY